MKKENKIWLGVIIFIIVLGSAFYILNKLPDAANREIICYPLEYTNQIYRPLDDNSSFTSFFKKQRYYFKFRNSVYYSEKCCGGKNYGGTEFDVKLSHSDPDTFKCIDANFAKDKNQVYYWGFRVKKADPATFQPLDWPHAKDKNYYFNETEIEGKIK